MSFKKIAVNTTYLEMLKRPSESVYLQPDITIERAINISISKYLEIYNQIGRPWGWASRLVIAKKELSEIIHHKEIYIYLMHIDGKLAGFCELDARKKSDIEVVYLGVVPSMIGLGLGYQLLNFACHQAFELGNRVWLHTCEYDHPTAIEFYKRIGFKIFDRRVDEEIYSSDFLSKASIIA